MVFSAFKTVFPISFAILLLLVISKIVSFATNMINERRFAEEFYVYDRDERLKEPGRNNDRAVRIFVIGDSYAANKKIDRYLSDGLSAAGISNAVYSVGVEGAKSKRIYKELNHEINSDFSGNGHPDFGVVLCGVNDARQHIGHDYYAHHMGLIIKLLSLCEINPIILSLPKIKPKSKESSFSKRMRLKVYGFLFEDKNKNRIAQYRKSLIRTLGRFKRTVNAHFIDLDVTQKDRNENLFKPDGVHLSERGYKRLVQRIVEYIDEKK